MAQIIRIPKSDSVSFTEEQVANGFTIGTVVYLDNTTSPSVWTRALSDTYSSLKFGIITEIVTTDIFRVMLYGMVIIPTHGYTIGSTYYLDDVTPGLAIEIPPTDPDTYQHAVFEVLDENRIKVLDQGAFLNQPGGAGPIPPHP